MFSEFLNVFKDYLPFIALLITLVLNVILVIKRSPWWSYLVGNILITTILLSIGFSTGDLFNFFGEIVKGIISVIKDIFNGIIDSIKDLFKR